MIQPIVIYGDEILSNNEVIPVETEEEAERISRDLHDTLAQTTGCGLACPQIGIAKNAFLVKYHGTDEVFFNVEILEYGKEMCFDNEGCLSIPDVYERVERPTSIVIKYQDEKLQQHTESFSGFVARIIQHEYDHICGRLFVERLEKVRAHAIRKKLIKLSEGHYSVKYKTKNKQ